MKLLLNQKDMEKINPNTLSSRAEDREEEIESWYLHFPLHH